MVGKHERETIGETLEGNNEGYIEEKQRYNEGNMGGKQYGKHYRIS